MTQNHLTPKLNAGAAVLAFGVFLFAASALAEDWPQWGRDASKNMYSPAKGLPGQFEPGKYKRGTEEVDMGTTRNVKFVLKLGAQTYGNPVVAQGKILVGTNNESPRDPQHEGDRSVVYCFDEKSGEFLWQLVVPKLASGKVNDWEGLGVLSSPCVEGNRAYLVTSRCEVICLDLNGQADGNQGMQDEAQYVVGPGNAPGKIGSKDADILWVYDMMDELAVFPHNAANGSPVIVGDYVYVCTSNGQDWTHMNVPSPLAPSLIALDKNTGKLAGQEDAGISKRIFHGQWGSPSAGTVNGRAMVFFGAGDGFLYGFDAKPVANPAGEGALLKTTWKVDTNPLEYKERDGKPIEYPDAEGVNEIHATPMFYKNRVYVVQGQDPEHGEGHGRLVCIDATKSGDLSESGVIWEFRDIHRSLSTASIDPETGLLFIGDFSGFVYCLEADTGKLLWTHDMKAHMWGSTLVADGKIYVGDEDGDFSILAASREKKLISEANLGAPIYSTAIVANGVVYVGTASHLYAIHDATGAR